MHPRLANTPVESHADLGRLVKLVSRIVVTSWGLSSSTSETSDALGSTGRLRRQASLLMGRQTLCLRDWDSIYNDEASVRGGRNYRPSETSTRDVNGSSSVVITARDPPVLDYSLPNTPTGEQDSDSIFRQPATSPSGSQPDSSIFGYNWDTISYNSIRRSAQSETVDKKGSFAAMFWSHRLAPLASLPNGGLPPIEPLARHASESQSFSRLMIRSQNVRQDSLMETGLGQDTNFRQGPAEVRLMETLVAPSTQSGWSRRDTYVNRIPPQLHDSCFASTSASVMDQSETAIDVGGP